MHLKWRCFLTVHLLFKSLPDWNVQHHTEMMSLQLNALFPSALSDLEPYDLFFFCYCASCSVAKTRSFPGADIGSDHELVMMTFKLRLQRVKNQGSIRIRFSLEKLKDPNIAKIFRATIGGKFAPLLALENQDIDIDALINSFNSAVTETANNILGKHRPAKPWVTDNILKLCDKTERTETKEEYDWRSKTLYRSQPAS